MTPQETVRLYAEFKNSNINRYGYNIEEQFTAFLKLVDLFRIDTNQKNYEEIHEELNMCSEMVFEEAINQCKAYAFGEEN